MDPATFTAGASHTPDRLSLMFDGIAITREVRKHPSSWQHPVSHSASNSAPRLTLKPTLWALAALAGWSFFLWRGLEVFGADRDINNVSFNSDSAIPVLMANDERPITVFNCYYYGADRWGAWPFIAAQLISRATGHYWTPESLTAFQIIWVFVGVWAVMSLSHDEPMLAGIVYLIAVCLHRESRYLLFELSQLYAWQTTALLLSWVSLRRLFDVSLEAAPHHRIGRPVFSIILTLGSCFLATWSSIASSLFLMCLVAVEALRVRSKTRAPWIGRRILMPAVFGIMAIAAANVVERQLKMSYRRYSLEHYGNPFITTFSVDTGYLATNLGKQWNHLARLSWWPLYVFPLLALLALAVALVSVRRKQALREQVRKVFARDTVILALGAYGIAAMNFGLAVIVDHVRRSDYDDRFLTLTNLFAPVSGMLTLVLFLMVAFRLRPYLRVALIVGAFAVLAIRFPVARYSPEYQLIKRTASILARRAPGGVLMGSYWDTYVFTALQRRNAMVPVPFEGESFRTPWTPLALERATQVIISYAWRDAKSISPPESLQQYGCRLRLLDPYWYGNELYRFALYIVER
jgi:hypothetical protein